MKNRRTIALLLAMLILLSSCVSEIPVETEAAVETVASETVTESETTMALDIPDVTFDGEEFRMVYRFGANSYNMEDVWADSLNGEVINDAVFNRNAEVEERFGLKLVALPEVSPVAILKKNVTVGDDFAEVLAERMAEVFPCTMQSMTRNLRDFIYTDFSDPWWDSNAAEELMMGDSLYFMIGDFNLSSTCGAIFLYFNKSLLTDNNFAMPYDLVKDGTWTYDQMHEMVNAVSMDMNGDGVMDSKDRFGFLTQVPYRLTTGFDVKVVERDDENYPVVAPLSDRFVSAMEAVTDFLNDKQHTISYQDIANSEDTSEYPHIYAYGRTKFITDQILFFEGSIGGTSELREMTSPYGILPMPKFDTEQERYYALVDEYSTAWMIPASSGKMDMTDIVLSYMAYVSDPLVEATYETTLKGKRMSAQEDADMLDLIRASTWYELSFIMDVGMRAMLENMVSRKNIASVYEKESSKISKKLEAYHTAK